MDERLKVVIHGQVDEYLSNELSKYMYMTDQELKDDKINYAISHPIILEGWISVEDRLPEDDQNVLCIDDIDFVVFIATYYKGSIFKDSFYTYSPTHWLPFTVKMPEK